MPAQKHSGFSCHILTADSVNVEVTVTLNIQVNGRTDKKI